LINIFQYVYFNINNKFVIEKIKLLLENGWKYNLDINKQNNDGHTAIMKSVIISSKDENVFLKYFLEYGKYYNLDINLIDKNKMTLLIHVCNNYKQINNLQMIKDILSYGKYYKLNLNKKDNRNISALDYAIMCDKNENDIKIIDLLLNYNTPYFSS
jgi:ankyrin repeat protein